ncbi:TKL/DRK protein kinase [Thecamonas trahens ATCC 50062]|uniref:TKL/DRK protein kinase n=1 Tax=Thecamonas trahens ATCC 50062 TaxID=461836 RepID=A0A0L0DT51_THETB|nr:TKL/DRK protein kinase [Thecamonas trahens ATCC 50062]KNC55216.1 TKL/DRK protein kinase [Thecamonas trahens ATCC 50062]|eukprot:XP_013753146.1 TKL/DRK protein kinase [Thecamonas trahens ATCC 50062]
MSSSGRLGLGSAVTSGSSSGGGGGGGGGGTSGASPSSSPAPPAALGSLRRRAAEAAAKHNPRRLTRAKEELLKFVAARSDHATTEDELTSLLESAAFDSVLPDLSPDDRVALGRLVANVLDAQAPVAGRSGSSASQAPAAAQSKQVEALLRTASKLSSLHLGDLVAEVAESSPDYGFAVCTFEQLQLSDYLGAGAFGQVMRGSYRGQDVAVKRMMGEEYDEDEFQSFLGEVALLAQLDHPSCVKFHAACVAFPNICIVTEFVAGGDLEHKLHETFEPVDAVLILQDVANAMAYLHSKRIIHRDLKPGNVLLTADGRAKVADFGLAKVREATYVETKCGTPVYVAPEVVRGEPYSDKADVYSYGVLAWEVVARDEPFIEQDYATLMDMIKDIVFNKARPGPMPIRVSPVLQETMYACLDHDVALRPSFAQVCSWIQWL